jgi:hypothetical protein
MILSATELRELTGRRQKACQVQALRFMCIEHKVRPDGSIVVLKAHVEQSLGLMNDTKVKKETEPNWGAI